MFQSKSGFQQVSLHEKSYYTLLQYHKRRVKAVDFFFKEQFELVFFSLIQNPLQKLLIAPFYI